ISGRVVLIWTEQVYFGAGGKSPLVVWTADGGAHQATATSAVSNPLGTRAAAVRPDGKEILFLANVSADGTVGDIVSATPDMRHVQTLAAGVNADVNGGCIPLVGFDGKARPAPGGGDVDREAEAEGRERTPREVAAYCPAGSPTATLSRWVDGERRDLATGLVAQPTWSSDARGASFFTILAPSATPVLVSSEGAVT